jgi:hypothetical protein
MTLIGSSHLPLLEQGTKTVSTAGTPVQLTSIKGKRAVIQALKENNDTEIFIGDSATVDALASPPVGDHQLFSTQTLTKEMSDTSKIYIDATADNGRVRYSVYG